MDVCFSLTMWYVNVIPVKSLPVILLRFFINYVVCKSELTDEELAYCYSFSLTMWYVNTFKQTENIHGIERFSLTMWYVNGIWESLLEGNMQGFFINYVVCK